MKKLIKIEIEDITNEVVHYVLTYSAKKWWRKKEQVESLYFIHNTFHPLMHRSILGTSLDEILGYDLSKVVHHKLMLIIEQGKNEYTFK